MPEPICFIEPFGLCVSQSNAVTGAFLTAMASLATTVMRIWFDRAQGSRQNNFTSTERERREEFESLERRLREDFERVQKREQQRFEATLTKASLDAQARIQKDLQEYIQLNKWREESWERNLERLEKASQTLSATLAGLVVLIDQGPGLEDLQMIAKTADVLDTFGEFKAAVGHFALPNETGRIGAVITSLVTKTLLTLSPTQAVRQTEAKKQQLSVLRDQLGAMAAVFKQHCGEFEANPHAFYEPSDKPQSDEQTPQALTLAAPSPGRSMIRSRVAMALTGEVEP
jgi:hypothetical protein